MKGTIACRIILSLLSLGWPGQTMSQLWDDFSDGDFNNGTVWMGDTSQFRVMAGWLQLISTGSDSSFIVTGITQNVDTMEWRFKLKMGFSASSQNYARYYLCSDSAGLEGTLSGYFLQFGESGAADAIELYRQNGYSSTLLARGPDSMIASALEIRVKVLRFPGGLWEIWCDYSAAEDFQLQATATDNTLPPGIFTGLKCVYTGSNSTHFFMDEVYAGAVLHDTLAPRVISASVLNDSVIWLEYDEEPDSSSAFDVQHYFIDNTGYPDLISRDPIVAHAFFLEYGQAFFSGGQFQLSLSGITDMHGNVMQDSLVLLLFLAATPVSSDIVISEIMADPTSAPLLPPYEYVEIFNRSQKVIITGNFTISDQSTTAVLPPDTLFPGAYRAYAESAVASYFHQMGYSKVKGLNNMPSLNNDGDLLKLTDGNGHLLDNIQYDISMYRDPLRDDKGWSLERRDVNYPCSDRENWAASRDIAGGTPGLENSISAVFSDTIAPWPVYAWPEDSITLKICFSEYPDTLAALDAAFYQISNAIGIPASVEVVSTEPCLLLKLNNPLLGGNIYTLQLSDSISDCAGNKLSRWKSLDIALPDSIQQGAILLNEILFNPGDDGSDFVEIYNAGNACINLADIRIAHADPVTGITDDPVPFSRTDRLLFPGTYAVAAQNCNDILQQYPVGDRRMLVTCDLPSFNDDEGIAVLLNSNLTELERFHYKDDYHFPLLNDPEGVSLERISPLRFVNDSSNWHSAAATVDYASPCAQNSQHYDYDKLDEHWLSLYPPLFSPDNDGYKDVLGISCFPSRPGYVAAVSVYNESGHPVRKLAKQELLGTEGHWIWDGLTDSGESTDAGIYVILLELFHIDGDTRIMKKAAVLAKRR